MVSMVVYGDFTCPLSALASARVDELLAQDRATVDWRAVEGDQSPSASGTAISDDKSIRLEASIAAVAEMSELDVRLRLRVPSLAYSPRLANAAFAGALPADRHRLRRRLFGSVWFEDRNIAMRAEIDRLTAGTIIEVTRARIWQEELASLPTTELPAVVTSDGMLHQGCRALTYLGRLATAPAFAPPGRSS